MGGSLFFYFSLIVDFLLTTSRRMDLIQDLGIAKVEEISNDSLP